MLTIILAGIAGIITAFGTVLAAILSYSKYMRDAELKQQERETTEAQLLRQQLRDELKISREMITGLNFKLDKLTYALDEWKLKYFDLEKRYVITDMNFREVEKVLAAIRTDLQSKGARLGPFPSVILES